MEIDRCGKLHNNKKLQKYISRYRLFREQVASGLLEKNSTILDKLHESSKGE